MVYSEFETMNTDELGGERNDVRERLKGTHMPVIGEGKSPYRTYFNNGVEQTDTSVEVFKPGPPICT